MYNGHLRMLAEPSRQCCAADASERHRVLVVDDDPLTSAALSDLLDRDGYVVECAPNGDVALSSIARNVPCLLVLDLMLPGVGGIEVLRQLRNNPLHSNLAVIAVTGSYSVELFDQCAELGVADFVHKPFDGAEMRFRVQNQIRRHEASQRDHWLNPQHKVTSAGAQDAIIVLDDADRITDWNPAAMRIFEHTEQEAVGRDLRVLIPLGRNHGAVPFAFTHSCQTGHGSAFGETVELLARRGDGAKFSVELSLSATHVGGIWCNVEIVRDITERKRTESSLEERERFQRTLLENLDTGVVIVDAETRVVEQMNHAAATLFRCNAEDLLGHKCDGRICPADAERCPVLDLNQSISRADCELLRLDGTRLPILKSITVIEIDGRKKLLETLVDLSEQKLRDGLYRAIFEHSFDAVMTIHAETGAYSSANPASVRLFGASSEYDFLLRTPIDYSPDTQPDGKSSGTEYDRLLDVALSDGHAAFDWTHQRLNGTSFEATVLLVRMRHGTVSQVQAIVRDVSEQRRVTRQLEAERIACERMELEIRATQKLEAIGQLAAGIAHEINTPTQFASDSVHFLEEALSAQQGLVERCRELQKRCVEGEEPHALVEEFNRAEEELDLAYIREQGPAAARNAIDGLSRIAAIVRAMKEFSHPDTSEMELADLNGAIRNTLMIARNEYKYVADVETELGNLPAIPCHLGALNQVFLNLIVNAAHAISDKVRNSDVLGRIFVRTQVDADMARIDISDTGVGIPEALRDRIFEPFFTTKEVGRGTGQGLAIARSIVCARHGGSIGFETAEGLGTTFTVKIPLKAELA